MHYTLLCLILAGPLAAFEGRLVDENGEPMAGARVQVLGGRGSVVVDSTGYFILEPTPELPFDVLISRPDGVLIQPLRVEEIPESGVTELQVVAALSGSFTVQGGAPDLELPPAVAVTISGRQDLDRRSPMQITDVLKDVPGTGANGSGHTAVPALRGLASARTLILLDEGRVSSERRAGPSATFVDPASIEEVEIVRGPGSVAYGSDALGGLIRMRTRLPSPGEPASFRYSLTGGSNDRQRSVDAVATTTLLGGGFMVGASYRSFENYSSPEGEVLMSSMESIGVRTGYQHELGPGLLRFLWRTDLGRDIGKAAVKTATKPTSYPEENSHRASLAYEQPGPGQWSRLGVSLFWDQYNLLTEADKLPTATDNGTLAGADVFAHDYGLRVEAERALGTWRLLLGMDAAGRYGLHSVNRYTEYTSGGTVIGTGFEESIKNARKDDIGLFSGLSGTLGRIAISSGLRVDRVTTRNDGGYFGDRSTSQTDISGFIGATMSLGGGFNLSAQLARGFRDPLLSDRYYRGISGRGFITGNPDLTPETSLQGDIALHFSSGPIVVSTYLYDYRIDDLIERYKEDGDYFFRNRGEAEVRGIEVEAAWFLPKGLEARLAASWQQGESLDDEAWIDGVPAPGVIFTLRQDVAKRWWWLTRIAAFDRDDQAGPNEVVVPGYTIFDASIGYRISDSLDIQLLGRNLFDRSYFSSADDNAVLDPGRTIVLNLRGRL